MFGRVRRRVSRALTPTEAKPWERGKLVAVPVDEDREGGHGLRIATQSRAEHACRVGLVSSPLLESGQADEQRVGAARGVVRRCRQAGNKPATGLSPALHHLYRHWHGPCLTCHQRKLWAGDLPARLITNHGLDDGVHATTGS